MIEKVNEQIEVIVAFLKDRVLPLSFCWGEKKYTINKINMVHKERDGRNQIHHYSVSCGEEFFRLSFYSSNNLWRITETSYVE